MTDNYDLIEINDKSKNSSGGTELMLRRIYDGSIPRELLEQCQIVPTRVRELKPDKYRFYYVHDLPEDPEVQHLKDGGWSKFHRIVFVSNWQAQWFIETFQIPWSRTMVMQNAIEPVQKIPSEVGIINLIYHTTPHRGLAILLPVFAKLCEKYDNLHLDLFSSFKLYGWPERDEQFKQVFDFADNHPKITNHGVVSNERVREYLGAAHIFAYPSIWPETSCLALIEAMSAQLNCIHPNYGALYETGANWTTQYPWHEDPQEHAKIFYTVLDAVIPNIDHEGWMSRLQSQKVYTDAFYNWGLRAKQWEGLLSSVINSKEPTEIRSAPQKEDRLFQYKVA
jgi:glycosyltransferase involved in cell wall biosynthesis